MSCDTKYFGRNLSTFEEELRFPSSVLRSRLYVRTKGSNISVRLRCVTSRKTAFVIVIAFWTPNIKRTNICARTPRYVISQTLHAHKPSENCNKMYTFKIQILKYSNSLQLINRCFRDRRLCARRQKSRQNCSLRNHKIEKMVTEKFVLTNKRQLKEEARPVHL